MSRSIKAARPRGMVESETCDRLIRVRRDFAVRPYAFAEKRWADQRISRSMKKTKSADRKKLIKEVDTSVKGIDFAAQEMALIIRSWMSQDD